MRAVCELCFHRCALEPEQVGLCRARINEAGQVKSLNYGLITSLALDPIEKKPLRDIYPGSLILSVGSFGCNLRCPFCQNHRISMSDKASAHTRYIPPEELAVMAKGLEAQGNIGVAYTYNEPLVGYEYLMDSAGIIRGMGMKNVLVTNATIESRPWLALLGYMDGVNIDLKGFSEGWYRRLGGDLETVMKNIAAAAERTHVEITTLLVPGENDSEEEIRRLAAWLSGIDRRISLHLSRFFPQYKMSGLSAAPVSHVRRLAEIAGEYLDRVYTGNC